jgi:hypothetical protein
MTLKAYWRGQANAHKRGPAIYDGSERHHVRYNCTICPETFDFYLTALPSHSDVPLVCGKCNRITVHAWREVTE